MNSLLCWSFFLLLSIKGHRVLATFSPISPSISDFHRISNNYSDSVSNSCISVHSATSFYWVEEVLKDLRGGAVYDDDDDDEDSYDEYDPYDDEVEESTAMQDSRNRKSEYDHSMIDPSRTRPHPSSRYSPSRSRRRKSSSLSTATSAASAATKLATKSLSATGSLAWNALVKQPSKLAFHVIRPKHVDLVETFGLWRLDQQVIEKSNRGGGDQRIITSVATIEFARPPERRGRKPAPPGRRSPPMVIVRRSTGTGDSESKDSNEENVYRAPYTFHRKNKYLKGTTLSSFQTSFVAPAFLVGESQTRLYGYKGTWQRKLADKSVIKLKGKIYQVHKQKFGKKRGEYVYGPAVGTFVMRRRISMSDDEEFTDDEDYDDEDEGEEGYDALDFDDDEEEEDYSDIE